MDWVTAMTTAFVTIMGTAAVSYFIQYSLIEKPRITIEEKRSSIDALKAIEGIIPTSDLSCKTIAFNERLEWRLECTITNKGAYGFDVNLENSDVNLYNSSDLVLQEYTPGEDRGFIVKVLGSYPTKAHVHPGESNLIFKHISLDRKKFPNGIPRDISVKACIHLSIKKSLAAEYDKLFPEFSGYIAYQKPPGICIRTALD